MYFTKPFLQIKYTNNLYISQFILIILIYTDIIYSYSKKENYKEKNKNNNQINEIIRYKTYDYISPLGSYNLEIGLSTFIEANIIKIYFTLLIPTTDENFSIKPDNQNFNEIKNKNQNQNQIKNKNFNSYKFILNTKEELIFLGVMEKNIVITKKNENQNLSQKQNQKNQKNFFFRLKEKYDRNFSSSSFDYSPTFSFVDFKIIVYNLNTLSKIEKFINVNKNYFFDKVIFYGYDKEITNKNIKKYEKIILKKSEENLENFFNKNKLKKGDLINKKIIIEQSSDFFVYGNSKERKVYSKNPQLKILNILLELSYEILD
jgi:hypothetical protein